jgi:hypothetical protein
MSSNTGPFRIDTPTIGNGGTRAYATAAATAVDIGGAARVWVKATTDANIRFGASNVTVTAADIYLTAGQDYALNVTPGATHFSVRRVSSSGTAFWKRAG